MNNLRVACSNIAWGDDSEVPALECLLRHGVRAIEFAPTRAWPGWQGATPEAARKVAERYRERGFSIVSLQSLFFAKPDIQLFGDDGGSAFETHLSYVADLGFALGARVVLLGAPRNRVRGPLPLKIASYRAQAIFDRLAQRYHDAGLVLAIEPARPEYGGDFLCTTREVIDLVKAIDHPGLGVHLDAAALHSAGERLCDIWNETGGQLLAHYQLSEPGLVGFERPIVPQLDNLRFLRKVAYAGWCSIEMARSTKSLEQTGPWDILRMAAVD